MDAVMWKIWWSLACLCVVQGQNTKIVRLRQGLVKGHKDGGVYAFHGIPYATAPTGQYRFQAPFPPPMWIDTLDAVDKEIVCPQSDPYNIIPKTVQMQEDCLIANVFTPDTDEKNLPVLVSVHGGAYIMGYGNFAKNRNLVKSHKIVVITFNYRLGAHGFLCLGTEDVPGNAGMKDQVALLRWVKDNIERFGGNPEDITISGYSAGSSSVDLLMLSKTTDGLFQRVIPESGANTAAFSIQSDPIKNAKEYAKLINFTNVEDFKALEEFFKTVPYDKLSSADVINRFDSTFLMSPCVENGRDEEPFLTESPVDILISGNYKKLPMLYGFANMEGLFRVPVFDQWKDAMNDNFEVFLPPDLQFKDDNERTTVANELKAFYFGKDPVGKENILDYVNFFSDVIFVYPTLRSAKLQVEAGNKNIYLYEYSFVTEDVPFVPHTDVRGANHCAQSNAVMDGNIASDVDETELPKSLQDMKRTIREIWANFIKTGKPVPEGSDLPAWPPVEKDWAPHMVLDQPLVLKGSLHKERAEFWENIYQKYYRNPISPSPPRIHTEL
ncbi:unnamed protein product [Leptosia nina]|uniref:Carboxylic ester hydrolase n=1 Tax=Leptosia nina TaxID=320188 RepID=A0AAV1JKK1_9NEOP